MLVDFLPKAALAAALVALSACGGETRTQSLARVESAESAVREAGCGFKTRALEAGQTQQGRLETQLVCVAEGDPERQIRSLESFVSSASRTLENTQLTERERTELRLKVDAAEQVLERLRASRAMASASRVGSEGARKLTREEVTKDAQELALLESQLSELGIAFYQGVDEQSRSYVACDEQKLRNALSAASLRGEAEYLSLLDAQIRFATAYRLAIEAHLAKYVEEYRVIESDGSETREELKDAQALDAKARILAEMIPSLEKLKRPSGSS